MLKGKVPRHSYTYRYIYIVAIENWSLFLVQICKESTNMFPRHSHDVRERSQVRSRPALESTWSSETLPNPDVVRKFWPCRCQHLDRVHMDSFDGKVKRNVPLAAIENWSKLVAKIIRKLTKMLPKRSQGVPKTLRSEVQAAFGIHLRVGNAFKPRFLSKTPAIWGSNRLQNWTKNQ